MKPIVNTRPPTKATPAKPRCGLCGNTKNLVQTECCGQWICDDESNYVLFSYARNSCSRSHRRYTLCASHYSAGHKGHWQDCKKCRASFQTEMYVWYGTNEYNFEKLKNPPHYEPTLCDRCGIVIKLGTDGHSIGPKGTLCERCCGMDQYERPEFKPVRTAATRKPKPPLPPNPNPADYCPELDMEPSAISLPYIAPPKVGRNDPCPCGSGKKFKKCCGG